MQSPDGRWRIEVMRRGTSRWYRLTHHDNVLDWLTITDVERILTDVGVDISHLTETGPTTAAGSVPA
jgi:bifunctional non-homologous end joining protein LigD